MTRYNLSDEDLHLMYTMRMYKYKPKQIMQKLKIKNKTSLYRWMKKARNKFGNWRERDA